MHLLHAFCLDMKVVFAVLHVGNTGLSDIIAIRASYLALFTVLFRQIDNGLYEGESIL